jgi:hypothetical protein
VALAGPVGCGSAGGDRSAQAERTSPPSPPPAGVRHAGRVERAHFALLRTRPEPLPASVRRILRRPDYGMSWDLAQRLPLATLRGAYWLIPGRRVLCLLHAQGRHEASSSCAPIRVALAHGIIAVSLREAGPASPAQRLTVGVMPDGVHRAVVHTGAHATTVAVTQHLLVLRDAEDAPPDRVTLGAHSR